MNYRLMPNYLLMVLLDLVVHNVYNPSTALKNKLGKIIHLVHQWKMSFTPYPAKATQEVMFSRTVNKGLSSFDF